MPILNNSSGDRRRFITPLVFLLAAALGCYMIGCTKPDDDFTPRVDTLMGNTPSIATGNIQTFTVDDSLVGYAHQTIVKWYVTETNVRTVVTLNGVKVALYGAIQSGPLYNTTIFTLAVNSGKTSTKLINVADPLTTKLWNEGRRWMPTDFLGKGWDTLKSVLTGKDSLVEVWKTVFKGDVKTEYQGRRLSFFLDQSTREEQLSSSFPKPLPGGKIQVAVAVPAPLQPALFIWKNQYYFVDSISEKILIMNFDTLQNSGLRVKNRIVLTPEY